MKLKLDPVKSAIIIRVSGPVDLSNIEVLRAGIKKLFSNGKNRIILNIAEAEKIPGDVIRELAILNILARELAGSIVLSGLTAEMKQNIASFAAPPVIPCFSTDEQAIEFFEKVTVGDERAPEELAKLLAVKTQEVASLKAQLSKMDPSELQKSRGENAELAAQVKKLEEQLAELIRERRSAPDKEANEMKIKDLEERLAESIKKSQAAAAKPK